MRWNKTLQVLNLHGEGAGPRFFVVSDGPEKPR